MVGVGFHLWRGLRYVLDRRRMDDVSLVMRLAFHIKDYPSREAQWVAAVKAWRKK